MEYEQVILEEIKMPKEFVEKIIQEIKDYVLRPLATQINEAYEKNIAPGKEAVIERQRIEKSLDERFAKLPKDIQEVIEASNYYDFLYEVGFSHNLTVEQMGALEETTTDVVTGVLSSEKFERTIEERVGVSGNDAFNIVKEINEKILKGIREKMMTKTNKIPITQKEPVVIKKSEEFILNKAGIHLNTSTELVKLDALELPAGKPATIITITPKALVGLAQKLAGPIQTKVETTEHTLTPNKTRNVDSLTGKTSKVDPYRETPE